MEGYWERISEKILWITRKAYSVIEEYPLCDNCLGRMFALLGRGYTNRERGMVLKRLIVQSIHAGVRDGENWALKALREMADRLTPHIDTLYAEVVGGEVPKRTCYICGLVNGGLEEFYDKVAREVVDILERDGVEVETFLLGAKVSREVAAREEMVKSAHGLAFAESFGAELKREVSKRIQAVTGYGLKPEFVAPDVVIEISYPSGSVSYRLQPLLVAGRYKKLARRVSQTVWITQGLVKKYPFSVEEALMAIAAEYDATTLILHGAGREDVDVRMLGTGRPFVAELKSPRLRARARRDFSSKKRLVVKGLVEAVIGGIVGRKDVAAAKEEGRSHSKTYRATIIASRDIGVEELRRLEEFFQNRLVEQRTPKRVRHRRPDVVRERRVYSVRAALLAPRVFTALIRAEGGLYIKELVSGDNGETRPSFSEVVGAELYCAELDVVDVESRLPWASVEYLYNPGANPSG